MKWNWQQKDWSNFTYNAAKIAPLERRFLQESGVLRGAFTHINEEEKKQLTIELISTEALKTSEIEGEYLSRDSVQSSVRRHFGLATDNRKIPDAEKGITEMMLNLHENFADKLTHKTLHIWHEMLCANRHDLKTIGDYRKHHEPMEVISGPLHKPVVHFEAPPSAQMQQEMARFITWFNDNKNMPALTKAATCHLYFVCIHPFEDGNGRIGRALVEKILAQALGYPTLIALSSQIEHGRKRYYEMLEKSNKRNEITQWIEYFVSLILDAQSHTLRHIEFVISKTKFFDHFRNKFNERQKKVIIRLFDAGPDGFKGGLSSANYQAITGANRITASRDLHDLVAKGALTKTGELKSTRYWLKV